MNNNVGTRISKKCKSEHFVKVLPTGKHTKRMLFFEKIETKYFIYCLFQLIVNIPFPSPNKIVLRKTTANSNNV